MKIGLLTLLLAAIIAASVSFMEEQDAPAMPLMIE